MKKKRGAKNKFSLAEEYKQSWEYVKESRNYIYAIIVVFFVFTLIGFFVPPQGLLRAYIAEILKELIEKTEGMSQFELIKFIFLNNSTSSFFGIFLGIFLGVFPIIASLFNGYVLGFVGFISVAETGGISILLNILPHGIFELPAIFVSLGMGLRFGTCIFNRNIGKSFRHYFLNSLRVFLLIVFPLLIIAAVIEGSLVFLLK